MSFNVHETIHRTKDAMSKLAACKFTVCGAGALGSHIVEGLARAGAKHIRVIDMDRVEERNLSTQPWMLSDVGSSKARILANAMYRAVGVEIDAQFTELKASNIKKLLRGSDVVVDVFDNSASRKLIADFCDGPCLHVGLASDFSELIWNDRYIVPSDKNDDVCDYPLARNLATITAGLACETLIRFAIDGSKRASSFTLGDLRVTEMP